MVVDALNEDLRINGAVEPLPEDFDATAVIIDPVPLAVVDNGIVKEEAQIIKGKEKKDENQIRKQFRKASVTFP